ncbi:hypothetical protein [Breoghania sp.]|uniref:hypothetical protein n=1 Tax=Breoghania sp. TaxID=2065378 RepID=UPI002630A20D|nr:hypothetical protein [Breoghania sp.]MDJ0932051.1 hypothetical protein [Breoghania sp.]
MKIGGKYNDQDSWGTVVADGTLISGEGCSISRQQEGVYVLDFEPSFASVPPLVGSQTGYGTLNRSSLGNVAFPFLNTANAMAITGNGSDNKQDQQFSFVAIGN